MAHTATISPVLASCGVSTTKARDEEWIASELSIVSASMSPGVAGDPTPVRERIARLS
jgi:hypothetical protein